MIGSILIVDDNENVLTALYQLLEPECAKILTAKDPLLLPGILETQEIDLILMDMNFKPGATDGQEGLHWLSRILKINPDAVIIMMTAYSEVELAIKAIKAGAVDFIAKPWDNDKLMATLQSGYQLSKSKKRISQLTSQQEHLSRYIESSKDQLFGQSEPMVKVFNTINKVGPTDSNVLILGENGTGKELIARELHKASNLSDEVFIHVDMGSISETLFESELFGHVKGAFTDARTERAGRIEISSGGTLFLDEIGNLPFRLQSKLLNVIQNREVYRIGSNKPKKVNFRLICATNQDIQELIRIINFREDLYYRINTIEIKVPPLRERGSDIMDLANIFLHKYQKKHKKRGLAFSETLAGNLINYEWPGNVRQLQNCVEKAVIMTDSSIIQPRDVLPESFGGPFEEKVATQTLIEVEKLTIQNAIRRNHGNISKAASELGLARSSMYSKMKNLGIISQK